MDDVNKQRQNFISLTVLGYGAQEFNFGGLPTFAGVARGGGGSWRALDPPW